MLERQRHVLRHRAPRQQGEILEDVGERVEAVRRRLAFHEDLPVARLEDAAHDAEEGGLAAARRADHRHDLARAEMEPDILEHLEVAIGVAA